VDLPAAIARSQYQAAMAARVLRIILDNLSPQDNEAATCATLIILSGRDICLTAWVCATWK